jgi:hypothetical protein
MREANSLASALISEALGQSEVGAISMPVIPVSTSLGANSKISTPGKARFEIESFTKSHFRN